LDFANHARAKAAGAPVEVDISKLEEGQLVRVLWRKQPVWIFIKRPLHKIGTIIRNPLFTHLAIF
jgi:ubiquinol-cytochrome c reductase iron-sulfur subunit